MTVKEDNYNYSIAFMKAFFSFCVVLAHYWITNDNSFYPVSAMIRMTNVAAPVFFLVSFYLTSKFLEENDNKKLGKRVWRLYYPQFSWGVIYYLIYLLIGLFLSITKPANNFYIQFTKKDLMWQVLFGSDRYLCPQFWYQFDIIMITLLFFFIFKIFKNNSNIIISSIAVISLVLQYTLVNYRLFCRLEYEMWYPFGRFMECIPFAVFGYLLSNEKIISILRKYKIITSILCIAIMVLISNFSLLPDPSYGFDYGGINILLYGILAFILFLNIPFGRLPETGKSVLRFLAKYSFGVFCIHLGIGHIWECILCPNTGWTQGTLLECVMIFIISLALAWVISLIPGKVAKQLVT